MNIALMAVDSDYPNLALMKISSWHKAQGDTVEWYNPFAQYDVVYMSKIFSFTPDYNQWITNAGHIEKGGTGYDLHATLPSEMEFVTPDYSLYPSIDNKTAYGFLTRGCPNKCKWCVVPRKEGPVRPYMDIDQRIRDVVPMGFEVHDSPSDQVWYSRAFGRSVITSLPLDLQRDMWSINNMTRICKKIGMEYRLFDSSIGTLGGGNHFIELGRSEKTGHYYLTIHSGSRNFGKRVCDYHAKRLDGYKKMLTEEVEHIKQTLPKQQWEAAIKLAKKRLQGREGYLTGQSKEEYLKDMYTAQAYASVNRYTILHLILRAMNWQCGEVIETVHNYINPSDNIIRKGAVSANEGEKLIIPMNMADGILLCRGKGNKDWNNSAPHGAGRLFSRTAAREQLSMDEFKQRMANVYSTSVCPETLDESPMAYKPTEEICSLIEPTVEVLDVIKPVINLKAK